MWEHLNKKLSSFQTVSFSIFLFIKPNVQRCPETKRGFTCMCRDILTVKIRNIYSKYWIISKHWVSSHSAPCRNSLLVSLLWCVVLMKCPIFTWITYHHLFLTFILRKPSNRNQLKVKIFHCLFYCHWNTTLDSNPRLSVVAMLVWKLFKARHTHGRY